MESSLVYMAYASLKINWRGSRVYCTIANDWTVMEYVMVLAYTDP